MIQKKFNLPTSLRFAWLLRSDVRGDKAIDDIEAQKDFLVWWVVDGQKEYPQVEHLNDAMRAILFEPLEGYPQQNGFGINRLFRYIYNIRKDIHSQFGIDNLENIIRLNQWFYVYGLKEHGLLNLVDSKTLTQLNMPLSDFYHPQIKSDLPALSPLMFFVWSMRTDIQSIFDLDDPEGRERFLGWFFFQGVDNLGIAPLLTRYWIQWLNQPTQLSQQVTVSHLAYLIWRFRQDVHNTFDLNMLDGQQGLKNWTKAALQNEDSCQWLRELLKYQETKQGVNLIGFAFGELGIGEDVRMAAAACDAVGIPYTVINIAPGEAVRQNDQVLAQVITEHVDQLIYRTNIFCLTGFDTARVYLEKGQALFEGRYNIGWWPWELPIWPEQWHAVFDLIDEVWAATTFTQQMYRQVTNKPVILMPLPVSVERIEPTSRAELGLPEASFLFLYVFDFNSYLARKNPQAAVKAFLKAFPDGSEQVGLVLKTMNTDPKNHKWRQFQQLCKQDSRIVLLEKTMDRGKVLGLINACDAYVSLHRSEGFGRTLAEAMLFGKPVVATDFSGNVDFLTSETGFPVKWRKKPVKVGEYPFVTEHSKAYWAEPNIINAAEQMQNAFKCNNNNEVFTSHIKQFAKKQFSVHCIGELMLNRLSELNTEINDNLKLISP